MKKILLSLLTFVGLATGELLAENCGSASVTISPAQFTAVDSIVITVDLASCSDLKTKSEFYLWIWIRQPSLINAPSNLNTASTNPGLAQKAKFTRIPGTDRYQIGLVPANFFGATPAQFGEIGVILKGNDWSDGQTSDKFFAVTPVEFVERVNRVFPQFFTQEDVVTLVFNQNLAPDGRIQDIAQVYVEVSAEAKLGNTFRPLSSVVRPMRAEPDKNYMFSFIPSLLFGASLQPGERVSKISYRFQDQTGVDRTDSFSQEVFTDY